MTKEETGGIGSSIIIILIFIYGIKASRGWKYWVLSLLVLPAAGFVIAAPFGTKKERKYLEPID
jgi:type IV secretory pathway VirB2 component (pilin)